jgi:predicted RNA-binding Zn-ribbon protein involved in translation (DUF1610 family)
VSDVLPKKQPAAFACPRCGDSIAWRECSQCGGLGAWQFIASSHCGVPQQGKFCSECGATLPAWIENCAFCAGRGWLAAEHACSAIDQPPPGRPFRVDPAIRPASAVAGAVEATPPPVATSAPPASPAAAPVPVIAAATAPAAAPRPADAVSAPPQPVPGPAAPEPKRRDRMNLWIVILFLLIFALLIASPELTETIRRSFQAVFVR